MELVWLHFLLVCSNPHVRLHIDLTLLGLGELTFLQLSTTYAPPSVGGHSVGYVVYHIFRLHVEGRSRYFASGTGAAGLVGAFLWWELRKFGVRFGVGLSSVCPFRLYTLRTEPLLTLSLYQVMPLIIPLTYFFFLPHNTAFLFSHTPMRYEDQISPSEVLSGLPYTPIATNDDDIGEEEGAVAPGPKRKVALSIEDKWRLVRPLLTKYMLPLCEYSIFFFPYRSNLFLSFRISSTSSDNHSQRTN